MKVAASKHRPGFDGFIGMGKTFPPPPDGYQVRLSHPRTLDTYQLFVCECWLSRLRRGHDVSDLPTPAPTPTKKGPVTP